MNNLNKLALIVALAAVACSAMAQGGGGGGGGRGGRGQRGAGGSPYAPMTLIGREEVQKELNITDEQKAKLTDLRTSIRAKTQQAMQDAGQDRAARTEATAKVTAEAVKSLGEILTPDQAKRLRELQIQWTGHSIVLADKDVQASLGITDDQKSKLEDLQKRETAANADLQAKTRSQEITQAEARDLRTKNQQVLETEIDKVLTDTQKSKLADMGGKPLAKPAPPTRGGGGGGI